MFQKRTICKANILKLIRILSLGSHRNESRIIIMGVCLMIMLISYMPNATCVASITDDKFALLGDIQESKDFVSTCDKTRLFYRKWEKDWRDNLEKKIILVLPGIGMHSGSYMTIANYLCPKGYIVYALDYGGHGFSEGVRGSFGTKTTLMKDIDTMVIFIKTQHPEQQIFLLGKSMGAIFALVYGSNNSHYLAGLILVAPGPGVHVRQLLTTSTLLLPLYLILAPDQPVIDLSKNRLEISSRDAQFKEYRVNDPLAFQKVSARYIYTLYSMTKDWKKKYPENIAIPTLIIQGLQDKVLDPQCAKKLYDSIESEDKEIRLFPDAYHTLFFDPDSPQVFKAVVDWLERH